MMSHGFLTMHLNCDYFQIKNQLNLEGETDQVYKLSMNYNQRKQTLVTVCESIREFTSLQLLWPITQNLDFAFSRFLHLSYLLYDTNVGWSCTGSHAHLLSTNQSRPTDFLKLSCAFWVLIPLPEKSAVPPGNNICLLKSMMGWDQQTKGEGVK